MERVDILVLFLTWWKCFSVISIWTMLIVGFLFIDLIMLRYVHCIPHSLSRTFIMNGCWLDFVQGFFSIYWGGYMVSIFLYNYIYWFLYMNHPGNYEKKSTWPWWITFFMCSCTWFPSILLKIFMSMFIDFFYIVT